MTIAAPIDDPLLKQIPVDFHFDFVLIAECVDEFCEAHLDDECKAVCRRLLASLCHPSIPLGRGKRESWAAGVVYTLQRVNFLDDPAVEPHIDTKTIAAGFGVSVPTVYAKGKVIRKALDVGPFDADFVLPGTAASEFVEFLAKVTPQVAGLDLPMPLGNLLKGAIREPLPVLEAEPPPAASHGYELQVVLLNTSPEVSRTLRVPDLTFEELHFVLQGVFDWDEGHLHAFECDGFRVVDEGEFQERMHEPDDRPEWATRLSQVLPDGGRRMPKFVYVYDFGDNWEHGVKMTRVLHGDEVPEHPMCIEGANAAPPEDCGGPWGYADLCDALADPTHPEHAEAMQWCGPLDPTAFDVEKTNAAIRRSAPELFPRKPRAKRQGAKSR
jgi:hypothetical protein